MRPASRMLSLVSTLALTAISMAAGGPEARAQIFDYDVTDAGQNGALGSALARIGDVDNDGCEDFIVGEPNYTWGGYAGTGMIRLMSGKTGNEIVHIAGNLASNLGASVAGRIDLDGDGFLDLLIGAPLDNSAVYQGGAVFGYSPHKDKWPVTWYGTVPLGQFGDSVRSLEGDVDGDGVDDFVVGAPGYDTAFVFSSKQNVLLFTNNGQSGSGFGTDVCRGGDLDNDGTVDYLVGSPDYVDSGGTKTGRVTAFSGKNGNKLWSVDGAADSKFGKSLAVPGDLDGDGQADIVVGAPQHLDKSGTNKTGCATVLSGANQSVLYKVFGDNANDTFGHSVHGAGGDIDNDGTIDFIVGAPQLLGSDVGYARAISGATGNTLFTFINHTDSSSKSDYGKDVCGGDFDGDGRTDVLIGGSNYKGGDGIVEAWTTAVADWKNYGAGWAGTNGIPAFTARTNPVIGKSLKLDLDDSAGITTPGELLIGLSKASIPSGKDGTLLVQALLFVPLSIPAGGLTLSGQVPDDPSLYGLDLYLQAIEADGGASRGLSFTRGLDLFFGFN